MDPLSRLPTEILHVILKILLYNNKIGSLAALFGTNKHLATATLPVLYSEPFRECPSGVVYASSNPYVSLACRLLLRSSSSEPIHPTITYLLKATVVSTSITTTQSTQGRLKQQSIISPQQFDYYPHILHLRMPSWLFYAHLSKSQQIFDWAYVEGTDPIQMCRSHYMSDRHFDRHRMTDRHVLKHYFGVVVYREANWFLCNPILEQLRTLTISVSIIDRYTRVMDRLENLEQVEFCFDMVIKSDWLHSYSSSTVNESAIEAQQENPLRAIVQFVQDHAGHFQGRLKAVTWGQSFTYPDPGQICREKLELDILRILPPLKKLTTVTQDNLLMIAAHLETMDLDHVQDMPHLRWPQSLRDTRRYNQRLLQRCRGLRSLHVVPSEQGTFKWAVRVRKELESRAKNAASSLVCATTALPSHERLHIEVAYGLAPLKIVKIEVDWWPITDELDDIGFAFGPTLETLKVSVSQYNSLPNRTVHLGQGWLSLPALTRLEVHTGHNRLLASRHLFRYCPNLEYVELVDHTNRYQSKDVSECLPATLAKLESIRLIGWGALTFHPATFHMTPALKTWTMKMMRDFIPPVAELDHNPALAASNQEVAGIDRLLWTWDWHLPNLESLCLTNEFAYRFQFRMLNGCPLLKELELYIPNSDGQATRILSAIDLFSPDSNDPGHHQLSSAGLPAPPQQAIVAPSLKTLLLSGSWVIDDAVLSGFLAVMFPKLEVLTLVTVRGFTLKVLVETIEDMPRSAPVKVVALTLSTRAEASFEGALKAGLRLHKKERGSEVKEDSLVKIRIGHTEYVVWKKKDCDHF